MNLRPHGRALYGRGNIDPGGERRPNAQLSPFLRHRVISEQELVSACILSTALKRPSNLSGSLLTDLFQGLAGAAPNRLERLLRRARRSCKPEKDTSLKAISMPPSGAIPDSKATTGRRSSARPVIPTTMRACLCVHLALHAEAAMGARRRFFLQNLLDGDPASNTLSWRWVGGLHA